MADALVGFSGFVGSTLLRQRNFDALFRSTNIGEIGGNDFGLVVCAGAPAQKWIANRDPDSDKAAIDGLIENLAHVRCEKFVLISTVDVFGQPVGVDEQSPVELEGLHPYGYNRRRLELAVGELFGDHHIVRLPGLVGTGLRKNVIFDLRHDNNVEAVDPRGRFQFYPMANLWYDLLIAMEHRLHLLHLTAEPIEVAELALKGFGRHLDNSATGTPASYDFRSMHAHLWEARGPYQYEKSATLQAVREYAQAKPAGGN